ncbi:MAG: Tn3 family transposase [Gammaproteobacteria bacterium]
MKQHWAPQELLDHWALTPAEIRFVTATSRTASNRLGCALLLKYFQLQGRFPRRRQDIPAVIVEYVAGQLKTKHSVLQAYAWSGSIIERHRSRIRRLLGFRTGTVADAEQVLAWMTTHDRLLEEHDFARLQAVAYDRYRELKIEPPPAKRLDRLIRSAVRAADECLYQKVSQALSPETKAGLDALLDDDAATAGGTAVCLSGLKGEAGGATLESILAESAKLECLRALSLPADLFAGVSRKRLLKCKRRIAVEDLTEIRRHPPPIRYTLLAAYCLVRTEEVTDTLVELLLSVIHKMGSRAKHRVDKEVIKDIKRVQGKSKLLYDMAAASLESPEGTVKDVIYPVAGEQTLRDLLAEYKHSGLYDRRVQTLMRGSYSNHYRRMVPHILRALLFCAANEASAPVIAALELMRKYAEKPVAFYPEAEDVPVEGVIKPGQTDLIWQGQRVNRIDYELCVLPVLREKLRCKEIYAQGASRYRNPDEDLPADFPEKRQEYFTDLQLPLSADAFIATQQKQMKSALATLDKALPKNKKVEITKRNGKPWIKVTPLEPQPEPKHLTALKAEVGRRWEQVYLLDILKETDLRLGFTRLLKSPTPQEALPRETLQIRLLLCLYALGTNAGVKRVASGVRTENYRDLLYILNRYINKDGLRAAIAEIANAVLRERDVAIWGEATSVASDSKKLGAWDQNLMTEWHIRYRGPGIMVYWHVEKKSLCIYSQIKRCSSSEVAAMIEGVLRHCTEMEVEKNYVDSHGQDEAAFAFCHLLGFRLLPRLKGIGRQKLYRPEAGNAQAYKNLQDVLSRPVNWELIRKHYDELVKYATALRLGTADAEAILSRFTRSGLKHPAFQALLELGKVQKTIFLCEYLHSEELRQEIQEGLNVVENWNSANDFIWYGKGGEVATNNREEQERAILSLHLLQICMVYVNTLLVQKVLSEPEWLERMQPEDFRGLNPLFYGHINPYGMLHLDMDERLIIE